MRSELQGWNVELEPDGSMRLTPGVKLPPGDRWTMLSGGLATWAGCGLLVFGIRLGGDRAMLGLLVVFLPLGGLLVWQGLRERFGREVWRVGPDRLEVRQTLFGFHRVRRYQSAALELVYSPAECWVERSRGLPTYRKSDLTPAQARNDPNTWWGLFVIAAGRPHCLHSSSRHPSSMEEPRDLGDFLSAQTGWPLRVRRG